MDQSRMKLGIAVSCLLAALLGVWPAGAAGPRATTVGGAARVIGPGNGEQPLLALIGGARLRVLVEAYALNDLAVIGALQAARRRGVDVRVMLDPHGLQSALTLSALNASNILTRPPNPTYAVTHLNAVVVDASAVAVLTTALTTDELGPLGQGYTVIDRDRLDVLQAASTFYDDWLRRPVSQFGQHLLVLPDDASAVAGLIGQAANRLEVYSSALSDAGVLAALSAARSRHVVVRLLTPRSNAAARLLPRVAPRGDLRFLSAGAGTVVVVDRRTVLFGSMDLTSSTLGTSRELAVVVDGQAVARAVDSTFFARFARGAVPAAPPSRPPSRPLKHGHTVTIGHLKVSADVSPLVRAGGVGILVVSTVAGARVVVSIAYPTGSAPGAGATGKSGYADKQGRFVYRWIASGRLKPGLARVRVLVSGAGATATYSTSFTVAS